MQQPEGGNFESDEWVISRSYLLDFAVLDNFTEIAVGALT